MRVPTRRGEILAQSKKVNDAFLTVAAIERMKRDVERLEKVDRPVAAEELRRCAAMGDLSENAAYSYAKGELRRINNRIESLKLRIANAIPIPNASADGRVSLGSTVVVEANGVQQTFSIVGAQEANPMRGRISYLSPVGSSLIGHAAGDVVGAFTIVEVR